MDLQNFVDTMNEINSEERSGYHLTYGGLIKALKAADKNATFDRRVKGIGSYRGYYIDVALFTKEKGLYVQDGEFGSEWDFKEYRKWEKANSTKVEKLPTNANELGELLDSLIGRDFIGYKGGNFTITEDKPLWLEEEASDASGIAVVDVDSGLNLVTKDVE